MRGGDGVPWPATGADFFKFLARFFTCFTHLTVERCPFLFIYLLVFMWVFGVLAAMCYHAFVCDILSALLTVP